MAANQIQLELQNRDKLNLIAGYERNTVTNINEIGMDSGQFINNTNRFSGLPVLTIEKWVDLCVKMRARLLKMQFEDIEARECKVKQLAMDEWLDYIEKCRNGKIPPHKWSSTSNHRPENDHQRQAFEVTCDAMNEEGKSVCITPKDVKLRKPTALNSRPSPVANKEKSDKIQSQRDNAKSGYIVPMKTMAKTSKLCFGSEQKTKKHLNVEFDLIKQKHRARSLAEQHSTSRDCVKTSVKSKPSKIKLKKSLVGAKTVEVVEKPILIRSKKTNDIKRLPKANDSCTLSY